MRLHPNTKPSPIRKAMLFLIAIVLLLPNTHASIVLNDKNMSISMLQNKILDIESSQFRNPLAKGLNTISLENTNFGVQINNWDDVGGFSQLEKSNSTSEIVISNCFNFQKVLKIKDNKLTSVALCNADEKNISHNIALFESNLTSGVTSLKTVSDSVNQYFTSVLVLNSEVEEETKGNLLAFALDKTKNNSIFLWNIDPKVSKPSFQEISIGLSKIQGIKTGMAVLDSQKLKIITGLQ